MVMATPSSDVMETRVEASHRALWRRTVLVVDDHSSVREALGLILDDTYDVLYAEDGPPALRLLTAQRVDAVLLDLGLREMDGFEVLTRIRAISPRIPVIILTVRTTAADVVRALKLGAHDYLTKPFDDKIVQTKLTEALAPLDRKVVGGSSEDASRVPSSSGSYIRPRCLILAGHVGTAGMLRVILDRYVPTNASTDCVLATHVLGIAPPDCIVIDQSAWKADGSTFVRILRMRSATMRIALLADGVDITAAAITQTDLDVTKHNRLDTVIRYVLGTFVLTGTLLASEPLSNHVLAALDYLRMHYGDPLSADGIAQAAAMSRSYLAQRFRTELGMSVSRFVLTLRVEIARLLLIERKIKLDEVAALTGFGDPSHLSRAFRAQTGYRPGAYRRRFALSA
jgi:CheY-like chemotaxis protein